MPHTMHDLDEIRVAITTDIDQLCTLLGLLFSQEEEFEPDVALQRQGLGRILADGAIGTVLVALKHRQVVGMVSVLYTVSTVLGARVALLEDLVVSSELRGLGIGTRLLDAAIDHCRLIGCGRITLLTDGHNAGAHRLYERTGFEQSSMVIFRRLLPNSREMARSETHQPR